MMKRIYNFTAESRHGLTIYTGSFKRRNTDRHGSRHGSRHGKTFTVIVDKAWNETIIEISTWVKGHETNRETVAELKGLVIEAADVENLLAAHGVL